MRHFDTDIKQTAGLLKIMILAENLWIQVKLVHTFPTAQSRLMVCGCPYLKHTGSSCSGSVDLQKLVVFFLMHSSGSVSNWISDGSDPDNSAASLSAGETLLPALGLFSGLDGPSDILIKK